MIGRNQRSLAIFALAFALIATTVAYAVLQTTLNISGTVTRKGGSWNIHFENVANVIKGGKATLTTPTISNAGANLTFQASLAIPKDSISFTVDVVNDGTIDAMLSSVTLSGAEEADTNDVTYTATYADGTEIAVNNALKAGQTKTIKVTVAYNDVDNISATDVTLNLGLTLIYVQTDGTENESGGNIIASTVNNEAEFAAAIANGGIITLANDISVTSRMNVGANTVINLNGFDLNASTISLDRPFYMTEGGSLTINADDSIVTLADHGLVNVPADVKNAEIILNGGTYTGTTKNGALIRLRGGNENVDVTLNNLNYNDASTNGYIVSSQGFTGNGQLNVVGGSYTANFGFQIYGLDATITDVEFNTANASIEASANSNVVVERCTATLAIPENDYYNALHSAVAGSYGGILTINGGSYEGPFSAYGWSSGSDIVINDGEYTGTIRSDMGTLTINNGVFVGELHANGEGNIVINGGDLTGITRLRNDATLIVKGGTFNVDPSTYVADGYTAIKNANNTWTVTAG